MKKFFAAAAAALLALGLAACSLNPASRLLGQDALYHTLPAELTDSELYRQAVNAGAVILYQGEPITTGDTARDRLARLEKRGGSLDIYCFTEEDGARRCRRLLYQNDSGAIGEYAAEMEDWTASTEPEAVRTVTGPEITRYGFFTAAAEDGRPCGVQVINDSEIYENAAELRQLFDTYLKPICRSAIGPDTWSSPEEAADLLWLAEDLAAYGGVEFREEYPDGWIPVNYLVELLSGYFDGITRRSVVYTVYDFDYASDCMHYTFQRDYDAQPLYLRVLSAHPQGELLRISYCLYDPYTGEPVADSSRVLSVKPLEDGSFQYMSNLMA